MTGDRLQLDVALELGGATISGTIDDRAGPVVGFTGWLELMSALDTVCARVSGTAHDAALSSEGRAT